MNAAALIKNNFAAFLISFLGLISFDASAKIDEYTQVISGSQVASSASFYLEDPVPLLSSDVQYTFSNKFALVVEIDMNNGRSKASLNYTIPVSIVYTNLLGSSVSLTLTPFNIKYQVSGTSDNFRQVYYLEGVKDITVTLGTIVGLTPDDITNGSQIKISANLVIDRIYKTAMDFTTVNDNEVMVTDPPGGNYFNVFFPSLPGADEYEIEYTYYSDKSEVYSGRSTDVYTIESFFELFRNNATRITTNRSEVDIMNVFPPGLLVFRYRGIQYDKDGVRVEGAWSHNNLSGSNNKLDPGLAKIFSTFFEADMIWQYQKSFVENDQSGDMVEFFDGSLRKRQSASLFKGVDIAASKTIYQDHAYDLFGRQVFNTLPYVSKKGSLDNDQYLNYRENTLLTDNDEIINGQALDNGLCGLKSIVMSNNATNLSAGEYYSANCADCLTERFTKIPESDGYAYTLQEFTQDNTGRIKRSSAPGEALSLGSGHETRYIYSKPAQDELTRLFGSEVGDASKYTKNMVVDPNGQVSISIQRADGKTIATSLAGTPPDNLSDLDSYDPENDFEIVQPIKSYTEDGNKRIFSYTLPLSQPSDVIVQAAISPSEYLNNCKFNVCYDCYYDIRLTVKDACGEIDETLEIKNYTFGASLPTTCHTYPPALTEEEDRIIIPKANTSVGELFITKEVAVSQYAIDYYTQSFLENNSCIVLDKIYREVVKAAHFNCFENCDDCKDNLGSIELFTKRYRLALAEIGIKPMTEEETNDYEASALAIYNELKENCALLCNQSNISNCEGNFAALKGDYVPGTGQYAGYETDGNGDYFSSDINSIFYVSGGEIRYKTILDEIEDNSAEVIYFDYENDPPVIPIQDVGINDFIDHFKPEWLDLLVRDHPEYCYYENCIENTEKLNYESDMYGIDTWDEAQEDNIYLGATTYPFPVVKLIDEDPLFADNPVLKSSMEDKIDDVGGSGYSLQQLVTAMIFCNSDPVGCTFPGTPCEADKDEWWRTYKRIYFGIRKQFEQNILSENHCEPVIPKGKTPRWIFEAPSFALDPEETEDFLDEAQMDHCASLCASYIPGWRAKMAENDCFTELQLDELMLRFQKVCESGCDPFHPFGSTVTSTPTVPYGDYSFNDAFEAVFSGTGSGGDPGIDCYCPEYDAFDSRPEYVASYCLVFKPGFNTAGGETWMHIEGECGDCMITCSADKIQIPNASGYIPGQDKYTHTLLRDSCLCNKLRDLEKCYDQIKKSGDIPNNESFLIWINSMSDVPLDQEMLTILTDMCATDCTTLPRPLSIPPTLQCDVCATPEEVMDQHHIFISTCGFIDTDNPVQVSSFVLHMNTALNLNLDAQEYFDYIELYNTYYNGLSGCADAFLLCPNSWGDPFTNDGCLDKAMQFVVDETMRIIEREKESLAKRFREEYIAHCLPRTSATVTYNMNEYHYTLYYYDQAGNLVATVPPAGVTFLPDTGFDDADAARANPALPIVRPDHKKQTRYWYNSLNQPVYQLSIDAGLVYMWYDRLGRVILSQKANQDADIYSYSLYDAQGRIHESGEGTRAGARPGPSDFVEDLESYDTWFSTMGDFRDVIKTYYDDVQFGGLAGNFGTAGQENLRKRIASVVYYPEYDVNAPGKYQHASHYSYDVMGNVKTLLQDVDIRSAHMYKKIAYDYEQASGKVLEVRYQDGQTDGFYHRYTYDNNSRLAHVKTSQDGLVWEHDGNYRYYDYGPLQRTTLGTYSVQGSDYFYTLQGWMKGMNSSGIKELDAGQDGNPNTSSDLLAFTLNYYHDDYKSIDNINNCIKPNNAMYAIAPGLYNGNIQSAVYHNFQRYPLRTYTYSYDQLNRLLESNAWDGGYAPNYSYDPVTLVWTGLSPITDHKNTFSYDADGNILTQLKNGSSGTIDDLTYHYPVNSNPAAYYNGHQPNRLNYIDDAVLSVTEGDLPDQSANNYVYDASGNLLEDVSEGLTNVEWHSFDKPKKITKTINVSADRILSYGYDATLNRLFKRSSTSIAAGKDTSTYYIRDAQGNVMATYNLTADIQDPDEPPGFLRVKLGERYIYGSSRLGRISSEKVIAEYEKEGVPLVITPGTDGLWFSPGSTLNDKIHDCNYELSNHLGNVMVTLSEEILFDNGTRTTYLQSYTDYYPFGGRMSSREFNIDSYRYGFNGKENDNEVKGEGNHQDYGMRIYDPRVGRFLSVDPIASKYPELTSYQFASNRPIDGIDMDGLEYLPINHQAFSNNSRPGASFWDFLSGCNRKSTSGDIMRKQFDAAYKRININGEQFYDVGKHVYYRNGNLYFSGSRAEQATDDSRVGIELIGNIDGLGNTPPGFDPISWNTTNPSEIELSQIQANLYNNCEGVCYATTESRAQQAYIDQSGSGVVNLSVSNKNIDHKIASSQLGTNSPFLGYGAGGPFAKNGVGLIVDNKGVWSGQLQKGALLQVWNSTSVNINTLIQSGGHSIIFRNYLFDNNGNIVDFEYTDYHGGVRRFKENYHVPSNQTTIMGVNLKDK